MVELSNCCWLIVAVMLIWSLIIHTHTQIEINHHCCRRQWPGPHRPAKPKWRWKARSKSLRNISFFDENTARMTFIGKQLKISWDIQLLSNDLTCEAKQNPPSLSPAYSSSNLQVLSGFAFLILVICQHLEHLISCKDLRWFGHKDCRSGA